MATEIGVGDRSTSEVRIERGVRLVLFGCAAATVLITFGILLSLVKDAVVFFDSPEVTVIEFLTATEWKPTQLTGDGEYTFGIMPLVSGTLMITITAAMIALPTGVAAAIYLSEYASERVRAVVKPLLEILAGVPTVVYGYFALVYITPVLRLLGVPVGTFNALAASIVVGVMIIPMVSSISEDALSAVPDDLRHAAYGLGSTRFDVSTKVVLPAAISGIFSSFILALSRAIGETMAVTIAAGQTPRLFSILDLHENLYHSTEVITAAMVNLARAEGSAGDTPAYFAMFALGLALFVMTFSLNLVAEYLRRRFREEY